jgi:predicted Zn-dependent protease
LCGTVGKSFRVDRSRVLRQAIRICASNMGLLLPKGSQPGWLGGMRNRATRCGWMLWALIGLMVSLSGCRTVAVTGRSQMNFLPEGQEMQLGFSEFQKMKQSIPQYQDPATVDRVRRVGERIAAVAHSDMPNAQWEFVVFDSPEVNAFCLPGGKVGIFRGILPIMANEEGMATVIGHEVAHAVARHGGERMSQAMGLQALGAVVSVASAESQYRNLIQAGYGMGSQLGVALPHSRKQEAEADEIGLIYMARAGYRPSAAVEFWERFQAFNAQQAQQTPWFLRTHPTDARRIESIRSLLPKAEAIYRSQGSNARSR